MIEITLGTFQEKYTKRNIDFFAEKEKIFINILILIYI